MTLAIILIVAGVILQALDNSWTQGTAATDFQLQIDQLNKTAIPIGINLSILLVLAGIALMLHKKRVI